MRYLFTLCIIDNNDYCVNIKMTCGNLGQLMTQ